MEGIGNSSHRPTQMHADRGGGMKREFGFGFKALMILLLGLSVCAIIPQSTYSAQPTIIDHTCTDIRQVPESAID